MQRKKKSVGSKAASPKLRCVAVGLDSAKADLAKLVNSARKSLQQLTVFSSYGHPGHCQYLSALLETGPKLHSVYMLSCRFGDTGSQAVARAIARSPSRIKAFSYCGDILPEDQRIAESVLTHHKLEDIEVTILKPFGDLVVTALAKTHQLRRLTVDRDTFGDCNELANLEPFLRTLGAKTALQSLELHQPLSRSESTALSDGLMRNPGLKTLSLSNFAGHVAVQGVSTALAANANLAELVLVEMTKTTDETAHSSMRALGAALAVNRRLLNL